MSAFREICSKSSSSCVITLFSIILLCWIVSFFFCPFLRRSLGLLFFNCPVGEGVHPQGEEYREEVAVQGECEE